MAPALPDPSPPVSTRTLNGALALPSLEARTIPTGRLGTQRWSFRMWWPGDQQWAGCSECAGTWGHEGCSLPAGMGRAVTSDAARLGWGPPGQWVPSPPCWLP